MEAGLGGATWKDKEDKVVDGGEQAHEGRVRPNFKNLQCKWCVQFSDS